MALILTKPLNLISKVSQVGLNLYPANPLCLCSVASFEWKRKSGNWKASRFFIRKSPLIISLIWSSIGVNELLINLNTTWIGGQLGQRPSRGIYTSTSRLWVTGRRSTCPTPLKQIEGAVPRDLETHLRWPLWAQHCFSMRSALLILGHLPFIITLSSLGLRC